MELILTHIGALVVGFLFGSRVQAVAFERRPWILLGWSEKMLGWRTLREGSRIKKGDKLLMALEFPSEVLPEGGISFEDQQE